MDCEKCRYYSNNGKDELCETRGWDFKRADCPDFRDKSKPITNADKLRSLSNWDLAMFFGKSDECPPSNPKCEHECNICWNEWLESEVENDQW